MNHMAHLRTAKVEVQGLKPGGHCTIAGEILKAEFPQYDDEGVIWKPADQLLSGVLGSGYEFRYSENPINGVVTFMRLMEPVSGPRRSYVEPDRLAFFEVGPCGIYVLKKGKVLYSKIGE
jgi:hypothetical protein